MIQRWHLLMLLGRRDEAAQALMPLERSGNTQAFIGFLNYRQFDPRPYPSLMAVLEKREDPAPAAGGAALRLQASMRTAWRSRDR